MRCRLARCVGALLVFAACVLAAEIDGVWAGQQPGRRGDVEDFALRFKLNGQTLTGKMFGDEFDLPISDASLSGDQIRFVVTTTNYYNGVKTQFLYTGTIKGSEMEFVRERIPSAEDAKSANRTPAKQTLRLKRID
jgi:hypothetical protein